MTASFVIPLINGLSFMGKKWDYDVPSVDIWKEALRVLKPGGFLLSFAGTRTQHRMAVNIEDAGFEIRDMIAWVYGSGFPKSLNIHKKDSRCPEGFGTALKPALEPITVARKPLSEPTVAKNVLKWGTGGINIDACRVGTDENLGRKIHQTQSWKNTSKNGVGSVNDDWKKGRFPANFIHDGSQMLLDLFPKEKNKGSAARFFYQAKASKKDRDEGTDSYLTMEIICEGNTEQDVSLQKDILGLIKKWNTELFTKSITEKYQMDTLYTTKTETNKTTISITLNCLPPLSIKDCILDAILAKTENNTNHARSAVDTSELKKIITKELMEYLRGANPAVLKTQLKTNVNVNNFHATVKPTKLMQYLVRLVTPVGGTVLDPFMGSGSTGKAAKIEGFDFIGIEMEEEYINIAKGRINYEESR